MKMVLRLVIGLTVFLLIFGGLHLYVYFRLNHFFKLPFLQWIIFSLALLVPVSMMLSRLDYNIFTRVLYAISSTWIGVLFFLFCSLIIFEVLRFFIKLNPATWGIILVSFVALISIVSIVNGQFVFVKEMEVPISGLDKPIKIIHLSDIHIGTIHNSGFLNQIVTKTNKQNPDFVVITGDLFDAIGAVGEHTIDALKGLKTKSFFSTGNHEFYEDINKVKKVLKDANITFLRDEVVEYKGIQIVGMDHPERDRFIGPDFTKVQINKSKPSILLYHQPKGMKEAQKAGIDLQLSGHTHKGQIFPFNFIVGIFYKYIYGLYKIDNMYLHVSPGTGTWGPPMRFGSKNEIAVMTLVPE